ncbi:hypothetical protein Gogos_021563 [Gossypium gossypioides]|uniref:Uncharacterized protein n=1 Tax=Gossypium gossypioides TaxID=34282 RepID=A0A7J9D5J7_GOSGO|nr:hypothetical protein [Gossypium gossypioides]
MLEDTQSREGNCQIASFDSSLPQIVPMDWTPRKSDGITYRYIEIKIKR